MLIPITTQATASESGRMHTVPAHGVTRVIHELPFPVAACPVSRNPVSGTVTVEYSPTVGRAIEVVSIHAALAWACSGDPAAPRSVEAVAGWLLTECAAAVGASCTVRVDIMVQPGPQRLVVVAG